MNIIYESTGRKRTCTEVEFKRLFGPQGYILDDKVEKPVVKKKYKTPKPNFLDK